jgi:NAD(P)-dependent dehydrogenase (short-subunit alcohol dehydrogenase family)
VARWLAREGVRLVISASSSFAGAQALAEELSAAGGQVVAMQADFQQPATARTVVRRALEQFGQLDILVNNAGLTFQKPFLECCEDDWVLLFNINLMAMMSACHEAAPHMLERRQGRIINISSVHSALHMTNYVLYGATKGAINAFTRGLAIEMAPHGVTANVIAPGAIQVERYERELRDPEAVAATIPSKTLGKPDDIAAAVAYLASDEARYVNGEVLFVDAGLTSRMAL